MTIRDEDTRPRTRVEQLVEFERLGLAPSTSTPVRPKAGRVDSFTARSDLDAHQGHFCVIDFDARDAGRVANAAVEATVRAGGVNASFKAELRSGDFGVYDRPATLGEDGYPELAVVTLRDEHGGLQVVLPCAALRPAAPPDRRR